MLRRIALSSCVAIALAAGAVGAMRVGELSALEVDHREQGTIGDRRLDSASTAESLRLATLSLVEGQRARFVLCTDAPLDPERWRGTSVAVWRPAEVELLVRAELEAAVLAGAWPDGERRCLRVGEGLIPASGRYAMDLLHEGWPPAGGGIDESTILAARVTARGVTGRSDLALLLLAVLAALGAALSLGARRPPETEPEVHGRWSSLALPVVSLLLFGLAFVGVGFVPHALLSSLALAAAQLAIAFALAPRRANLGARLDSLGLVLPARPLLWALGAVMAGLVLVFAARWAIAFVPSTGTSVVQQTIAWPSGLLAFALASALAPAAEDIFFRGLLYGHLRRFGVAVAVAGSAGLFILAHLPQTAGQWGALVGVSVLGLGLSGLRAASRSVLAPVVAHAVYNAALALPAI